MGSLRELFMALRHELEDRIEIRFPLSLVSPLGLEESSQWDEGTRAVPVTRVRQDLIFPKCAHIGEVYPRDAASAPDSQCPKPSLTRSRKGGRSARLSGRTR